MHCIWFACSCCAVLVNSAVHVFLVVQLYLVIIASTGGSSSSCICHPANQLFTKLFRRENLRHTVCVYAHFLSPNNGSSLCGGRYHR